MKKKKKKKKCAPSWLHLKKIHVGSLIKVTIRPFHTLANSSFTITAHLDTV
jgi:hypothetical protein